jgi:hypothetical protein
VQSGEMRKAFRFYPELQISDGTFKVNAQNYFPFVQMAQDGDKRGLPVSYCFHLLPVSYCFMPHLRFYYECMSKHNDVTKTEIVFVDKDLRNNRLIPQYYTNRRLLLSTFHVLKYLKAKIYQEDICNIAHMLFVLC